MKARVLAIDDDRSVCEMMASGLEDLGYGVEWRTNVDEALELAATSRFDVVVTDLNMGRKSGLDVCAWFKANHPDIPVVLITAFGNMETAIGALRAGAHDYINKPFSMAALEHTLGLAVQHRRLREQVEKLSQSTPSGAQGAGNLIGRSPPMQRVYELIQRVAPASGTVLVTGESGTGKELVARALHSESERASKPFVPLNCAAVPANLLESELFGHVKGAFTDAKEARRGIFEQGDGGTVFLDEVGEMPLEMQAKLLRVLQERTVRRVGAETDIPFDARVVAATNRDLESEVEEGRFREDLYYRLDVVQIHLPRLAARGNDILLLAQHFVQSNAQSLGKAVTGISPEAARLLLDYDWPGNVRQLQNAIERAVTLTEFEKIKPQDLPAKIRDHQPVALGPTDLDPEHMLSLADVERRHIEAVLKAVGGNKTEAARVLGMDRRTLYRKLERFTDE